MTQTGASQQQMVAARGMRAAPRESQSQEASQVLSRKATVRRRPKRPGADADTQAENQAVEMLNNGVGEDKPDDEPQA